MSKKSVDAELLIEGELPATATLSFTDEKTLNLRCTRVILTLIQTRNVTVPMGAIQEVSITAEGKGMMGNKYQAVLLLKFEDGIKPYTFNGKGQHFVTMINNVAARARLPLKRV